MQADGRRSLDARAAARPAAVTATLRSRAFLAFWVAYLVANAADMVTTGYALAHGLRERNPLASSLYASGGMGSLGALKACILGVMLAVLVTVPRRMAITLAAALALTMAIDVVFNMQAIVGSR